jgi:transposase
VLRRTKLRDQPRVGAIGFRAGQPASRVRLDHRGINDADRIAMRRTKNGSGLGRWRWVSERTFAWLNQFRRLRVRYDKRADIHEAFLSTGCVWICWQSLRMHWMTA